MSISIPKIPFTILVLSPFAPVPATGYTGPLIQVDLSNLDQALAALKPRFVVPVSKDLCPDGGVLVEPGHLKDLRPEGLIKAVPFMQALSAAHQVVAQAVVTGQSPTSLAAELRTKWPELPPDLVTPPAGGTKPKASNSALDDIFSLVAAPSATSTPAVSGGGDWAGRIEARLAAMLAAIYENPDFRALEAAWRGLEILLKQGPVKEGQGVLVNILPVDQASLEASIDRLTTELANLPPNLILIDLPVGSTPQGISLMEKILGLADDLMTPTVCWLGPRFFHLDTWAGLGKVQYLKHFLEDAAYAKWRKLADLPGANWVTVTLNCFVGRLPYGPLNKPKTVMFDEKQPVWLSPVWAWGAIVAQSVLIYGWASRFTDYVNLAVRDLTVADLTGEGPLTTEMALGEDRLMEFLQVGLTPLLGPARKDQVFIPKEVTLGGGSLKSQLFVGRVLNFLLWCRENLAVSANSADLAGEVQNALAQFWHRTGHQPPADLSVTAGQPRENGTVLLNISLTPSRVVLPGGQKLEFSFVW